MLADARVADSAVPIWIAPPFSGITREKSCLYSIAGKHQNVQGVCLCQHSGYPFFTSKAHDPTSKSEDVLHNCNTGPIKTVSN